MSFADDKIFQANNAGGVQTPQTNIYHISS